MGSFLCQARSIHSISQGTNENSVPRAGDVWGGQWWGRLKLQSSPYLWTGIICHLHFWKAQLPLDPSPWIWGVSRVREASSGQDHPLFHQTHPNIYFGNTQSLIFIAFIFNNLNRSFLLPGKWLPVHCCQQHSPWKYSLVGIHFSFALKKEAEPSLTKYCSKSMVISHFRVGIENTGNWVSWILPFRHKVWFIKIGEPQIVLS